MKNSNKENRTQEQNSNPKQAGAETKSKNNENGYGNHKQEPEANDDPLTKGHVISNQDEKDKNDKKDLKKEVDNDGTTAEGR